MKENGFSLKKPRRRRYLGETITDADNADGIALLSNTPTQAEFKLHSLEQAAEGVGVHINTDKTEYILVLIKKETSAH